MIVKRRQNWMVNVYTSHSNWMLVLFLYKWVSLDSNWLSFDLTFLFLHSCWSWPGLHHRRILFLKFMRWIHLMLSASAPAVSCVEVRLIWTRRSLVSVWTRSRSMPRVLLFPHKASTPILRHPLATWPLSFTVIYQFVLESAESLEYKCGNWSNSLRCLLYGCVYNVDALVCEGVLSLAVWPNTESLLFDVIYCVVVLQKHLWLV